MSFLLWSDEYRYRDLVQDLKEGLFQGRYNYSPIVTEEYKLLIITSREISFVQQRPPLQPTHFKNGRNNYSFVQCGNQQKNEQAPKVAGGDGVTHYHIICKVCFKHGSLQGTVYKLNRSWTGPSCFCNYTK